MKFFGLDINLPRRVAALQEALDRARDQQDREHRRAEWFKAETNKLRATNERLRDQLRYSDAEITLLQERLSTMLQLRPYTGAYSDDLSRKWREEGFATWRRNRSGKPQL